MNKSISTILHLLLITLGCVLFVEGLYKAAEKYLFVSSEGQTVAGREPEKQLSVATFKRTVEDDVRIILQRNLFGSATTGDKEAGAEGSDVDGLQPTSLELVLLGTVIGDKDESRAIILEKDKKTQDIYQLGEIVQGAVLKEILRGKVVLTYNNRDEILDMSEAEKYSAELPAAAAAAAASTVRQGQTLPGPAPQEVEPQAPSPVPPQNAAQPRVIRPSRQATTLMPTQPSQ